jgi:hypothetical protein
MKQKPIIAVGVWRILYQIYPREPGLYDAAVFFSLTGAFVSAVFVALLINSTSLT